MRLDPDELTRLVEQAHGLMEQHIIIHESLSRSRDRGGHDRHFATSSCFAMTVRFVGWILSGSQLTLSDELGRCYGINTDSITHFSTDERGTIEIIEQFEAYTERRTRIMLAAYVQARGRAQRQFLEELEASLERK